MTISWITPTLGIGDWQDTELFYFNNKKDIFSIVITVATESPFEGHVMFPLYDGEHPSNEKEFWMAVDYLNHFQEGDHMVLVHCMSGVSRSPAVVIGYLIKYRKMPFNDALSLVKKRRPVVLLDDYFYNLLKDE